MKVSIVTISYNQVDFLERALQSVIEQNYSNVEYIVVDPGSTDGSREILERYRSKISTLIYEPDSGPSDGLNKGFAVASGDVFGFLNSDDILLPDAIKKVVEFFRRSPQVDVVSGHTVIIDQNDTCLRSSFSDRFSLIKYAYGAAVLMQPSTFFKAHIYKKIGGFNVANGSNWDGELFVDMGMAGARFAVMDEFLSGYRLHPQSITSSKKLDAGMRTYNRAIFRKIMGRDKTVLDKLPAVFFRLVKHLGNPKALSERILKGPVYGRSTVVPDKSGIKIRRQ